MLDFLSKMTGDEEILYKEYMNKFMNALKVFCGLEEPKNGKEEFYKDIEQEVNGYIKLMKKYVPDLKIPDNLGDNAIKFFVISEVHRLYNQR